VLKVGTYIPFVEEKPIVELRTVEKKPVLLPPSNIVKPDHNVREIPIFLKGDGREAKLILPLDYTDEDLQRIVNILNAYKS
jgi:hypothetical protein